MKRHFIFLCLVLLATGLASSRLEAQATSCTLTKGSGTTPTGLAVDTNTGNVWVPFLSGNYVLEMNPANCTEVAQVTTQTSPTGIAFDGTNIWVANYKSNTVSEINSASATLVATIAVGSQPRGVVFDGTYIWVANEGSNTVTKLSTAGGFLGNFTVGSGPYYMGVDTVNNTIWVANRNGNTVTELNQSGGVVNTIATDSEPQFVAFDGTNIWVSCYSAQKVDKISPSGSVLQRVAAPHSGPTGLVWDPRNGFIWGVSWGGYLYAIDPNTGGVSHVTFETGIAGLFDVIWNNGFLYLTDDGHGTIAEIVP
jgi:YVTN family beta-propeller protein